MSDLHLTTTLESPDFEQLYRALVHNLPTFAIFALDGSGRISSWNKGVETNLGYKEREFVGQQFELIFTEEDRRNHVPTFEMERAKREGHAPDKRWHVRKDGTRLYVDGTLTALTDDTGQVIGFCKIMRDATEEHLAEQRLASALDYSESIVDTIRQPLLVLDTDLRVVSANRSFYRDFSAVPEASEGYLLHELGGGQWNIPRLRELLEDVLPQQSTIDDFEVQHEFPGMGQRTMLFNARKLCRQMHGRQLILLAIEDITGRRQAEASLLESERQRRAMMNAVPAVISYVDQKLRYKWVNDAYERWFGLNPSEMTGKAVSEVYPPEVFAEMHPRMEKALDGELVVFDLSLSLPGGEARILQVTYTPDHDQTGQVMGFVVLGSDITEHQRIEAQLRDSERQLREIVNSLPQILWRARADGAIYHVNDQYFIYTGAPAHQNGDVDWHPIAHAEDLPETVRRWSECVQTGEPFEVHQRIWHAGTGQHRWNLVRAVPFRDEEGRVVRWLGTSTDIEEQKRAADALRESEEFARSILASSPDCVKVLDLEGRLLSVNESGCQQLEIADLSACLNLPWPEMWGPEQQTARNAVTEAAAGNTVRFESYCPTLKGTPKWWEVIVTPIRDASGQPVRLLSLSRDITDRRRAEQERERLLRELERSNSELSDFAHVAAHDLQTPLRTILSYAQLLDRRSRGQLDETGREFLQMVLEGGARMDQLVRALLNYAQVGQGTPLLREISMQLVVDGALDNLQALISESESKVICGELPIVWGEGVQLLQLVQNLVSNGVKYARPGIQPRIQIAAELVDHLWRFSFQDNGQGIASEYCEQIFQPFRRLHGYEIAGTGMGLAVARKIVERHGGQLWVESKPGEGSTFFFTLPSGRM